MPLPHYRAGDQQNRRERWPTPHHPPTPVVPAPHRPQISDFNLAKKYYEEVNSISSIDVANPRWLAPEVLQGNRHSLASVGGEAAAAGRCGGVAPRPTCPSGPPAPPA